MYYWFTYVNSTGIAPSKHDVKRRSNGPHIRWCPFISAIYDQYTHIGNLWFLCFYHICKLWFRYSIGDVHYAEISEVVCRRSPIEGGEEEILSLSEYTSSGLSHSFTHTFAAGGKEGNFLLIYICNFHVLSYLLLIYICKLHWNLNTMFVWKVIFFWFTYVISMF